MRGDRIEYLIEEAREHASGVRGECDVDRDLLTRLADALEEATKA